MSKRSAYEIPFVFSIFQLKSSTNDDDDGSGGSGGGSNIIETNIPKRISSTPNSPARGQQRVISDCARLPHTHKHTREALNGARAARSRIHCSKNPGEQNHRHTYTETRARERQRREILRQTDISNQLTIIIYIRHKRYNQFKGNKKNNKTTVNAHRQ